MFHLSDLILVLDELAGKIQTDVHMTIQWRIKRDRKPVELSSSDRMLIPPMVLNQYFDKKVAMFRVKVTDHGTYMIDIMLEG